MLLKKEVVFLSMYLKNRKHIRVRILTAAWSTLSFGYLYSVIDTIFLKLSDRIFAKAQSFVESGMSSRG